MSKQAANLVLFLCLTLIFCFEIFANAAQAAAPERPATPVVVENAGDDPVPVSGTVEISGEVDVNEVSTVQQMPVQVTRGFDFSSGGLSTGALIMQVPADKLLVVKHVSLRLALPTGQTPVGATLNGGLNSQDILPIPEAVAAPHELVPSAVGSLSGQDLFSASHKMEMFVEPGNNLGFALFRSADASPGFASGRITISGRLVDCPGGLPCPLP